MAQEQMNVEFQSTSVRRLILGSYWLVILLALPLWWSTTSIERLKLPASHVRAISPEKLRFPIHVQLDATLAGGDSAWLAKEVQGMVVARLNSHGKHGLDVRVTAAQNEALPSSNHYSVKLDSSAQGCTIVERTLTCSDDALSPSKLANFLISLLSPHSSNSKLRKHSDRVAKYASRYRLAFSLLNEDASQGPAAIGWDIHQSIARYLSPTLDSLSVLHNFTIESQVQFHAPLAFAPRESQELEQMAYGLTGEDLTVFVNSAEWTLSSSASNDPVLHFILFVPSASRRPLRILDSALHTASSSAFILPQWGGITLYNPPSDTTSHLHMSVSHLEQAFSTFKYQLSALLGVPALPSSITSLDKKGMSPWQLDAILRRRALENVQDSAETLQSIVKLVDKIENMPVKEDVRGDILEALAAFEMTHKAAPQSASSALLHSSRALSLSSRAFFNPGMLALLYFPPEHTYAVYAPLFAPVSLPLIAPVLKEFMAWWRARKQKKAEEGRQKTD